MVTLKEHVDRLFFISNPPFALGIYSSWTQFCRRSAVTRVIARALNETNKHDGEKSNGTQKTISQ